MPPSRHSTPSSQDSRHTPQAGGGLSEEGTLDGERLNAPPTTTISMVQFGQIGRIYGRLGYAFTDVYLTVTSRIHRGNDDNDDLYTKEQNRHWQQYKILKSVVDGVTAEEVNLDEYLLRSTDVREHFCRMVTKMMNAGRSEDMHIINVFVPKYFDDDTLEEKAARGIRHEKCCEYLRPKYTDHKDPDVFANLLSGALALTFKPDMAPAFLWTSTEYMESTQVTDDVAGNTSAEDSGTQEDVLDGYLRGDLMLQGYRKIYLGRRAGSEATSSTQERRRGAKGAKSKGEKCGIDRVTPEVIAYVACLIRAALTTTASFEPGVDSLFNYIEFYEYIVGFFDGDDLSKQVLEYWDSKIYPQAARSPGRSSGRKQLDPIRLARQARAKRMSTSRNT